MMETTSTNTDLTRMSMIDEVKTRTDDAPCGMRNVGSSCWYNAVIQCMFHVPALRRRILSSELRGTSLSTEFDAIRKTFTLLKGSKKSTIETADYVQVFKAHMPSGSTQQDVSEFVHKLLDVCESALKPEGTANAENPIKKLFYGTLKEIGKTDEEKVSFILLLWGVLVPLLVVLQLPAPPLRLVALRLALVEVVPPLQPVVLVHLRHLIWALP